MPQVHDMDQFQRKLSLVCQPPNEVEAAVRFVKIGDIQHCARIVVPSHVGFPSFPRVRQHAVGVEDPWTAMCTSDSEVRVNATECFNSFGNPSAKLSEDFDENRQKLTTPGGDSAVMH